jgi:hypothetical protein
MTLVGPCGSPRGKVSDPFGGKAAVGKQHRMRFFSFWIVMMTNDALGQKQSLRDQLVGTWTLLS